MDVRSTFIPSPKLPPWIEFSVPSGQGVGGAAKISQPRGEVARDITGNVPCLCIRSLIDECPFRVAARGRWVPNGRGARASLLIRELLRICASLIGCSEDSRDWVGEKDEHAGPAHSVQSASDTGRTRDRGRRIHGRRPVHSLRGLRAERAHGNHGPEGDGLGRSKTNGRSSRG